MFARKPEQRARLLHDLAPETLQGLLWPPQSVWLIALARHVCRQCKETKFTVQVLKPAKLAFQAVVLRQSCVTWWAMRIDS